MITLLPLLALADPLNENPIPEAQPTKLFGLALRDLLLIAGVAIILGLALFLWAYLTHKGRRRHSGQHLSKPIFRAEKKSADASSRRVRIRRKRRDHPDHLPRNPTLGETGGLPPIRPDEPPPPEPAQQV